MMPYIITTLVQRAQEKTARPRVMPALAKKAGRKFLTL